MSFFTFTELLSFTLCQYQHCEFFLHKLLSVSTSGAWFPLEQYGSSHFEVTSESGFGRRSVVKPALSCFPEKLLLLRVPVVKVIFKQKTGSTRCLSSAAV